MLHITHDQVLNQFMEIIDLEQICALSSELHKLSYSLKESRLLHEKEKLDLTKEALLKIGEMADFHSKMLGEIAQKHKILIEKIENNYERMSQK